MPCGGCAAGRIFFERKSALRKGNRHAVVAGAHSVRLCPFSMWGTFPEKRGSGLGCRQTRFAPTAVGKGWLEGKTTLFLRKK